MIEVDPISIMLSLLLFAAAAIFYAGTCTFVGSLVSSARDASSFIGPAIILMVFPLYFMHMLQAGIDLTYIRDFLRHSQITTTQVYAKADVEMHRKIIEESAPKLVPDLPDWRNDASLMAMLNNIK